MAISAGQSLAYNDLKSIYNSFNTFIANYGGSIGQLTVPDSSKVRASDVNNLNTKITAFKNDTYLKTQTSWWVNASVTAGNKVYATDMNGIITTQGNFSKVKCRNSATNSRACSHGTDTQSCSYGQNTVTCSNTCSQACSHGSHTQNNDCNYTCQYHQTCSNTSGAAAIYDSVTCSFAPYTATHFRCHYCNQSGACTQVVATHAKSGAVTLNCTITCSNTCSISCNNGSHTQTCTNTCTVTCSKTCSDGTTIDITCQKTTNTN